MIELLMTSYFVFSSIYGTTTAAVINDSTSTAPVVPLTKIEETATTTIPTRKQVEKLVKEYFKNDPILVEIARCESEFRQYDKDGHILTGTVNKGDLGVMQINKYYHADKAKSLGYDLKTVEGNMAYAKYLYDKEGVQPWVSSSPCWKGALNKINKDQVALNR
jgi:hypothetical protein